MYDNEYTPFQTFMFFFVIIAMFVGFGIFVYVNKDKPKLEARETTQVERNAWTTGIIVGNNITNHISAQQNVNMISNSCSK
jgi:O-antigen/teichoic acid export membrane protein